MTDKTTALFSIDLEAISEDDLILLRIQIEKEFRKRGVKFNVGEIGETIAIDFFKNTPGLDNLQRAPVGTKNVDALSRRGERYSIKTIKDGSKSGTIYPDPDDNDKQLFEYILIVLLDDDFALKGLHKFSWAGFIKIRSWDKTMNAWYIRKSQRILNTGVDLMQKTL